MAFLCFHVGGVVLVACMFMFWEIKQLMHIKLKVRFSCHLYFSRCENEFKERCSQKVQVDVGERNWTLTAQNKLGKVELLDRADLTKRGIP